jgi:hypothetical protein
MSAGGVLVGFRPVEHLVDIALVGSTIDPNDGLVWERRAVDDVLPRRRA